MKKTLVFMLCIFIFNTIAFAQDADTTQDPPQEDSTENDTNPSSSGNGLLFGTDEEILLGDILNRVVERTIGGTTVRTGRGTIPPILITASFLGGIRLYNGFLDLYGRVGVELDTEFIELTDRDFAMSVASNLLLDANIRTNYMVANFFGLYALANIGMSITLYRGLITGLPSTTANTEQTPLKGYFSFGAGITFRPIGKTYLVSIGYRMRAYLPSVPNTNSYTIIAPNYNVIEFNPSPLSVLHGISVDYITKY